MAFSYRLRERAREDLRETSDHIAEDDPRAALNLYDRFVAKFELLAAHPEIGNKRPEFGEGNDLQGFRSKTRRQAIREGIGLVEEAVEKGEGGLYLEVMGSRAIARQFLVVKARLLPGEGRGSKPSEAHQARSFIQARR